MATILLSAAGAAIGGGFGGAVLGLSGAVIGRAIGASVGRMIDQRLIGAGSAAVETGRVDRLRLQTTGEGTAIARLWGQMRVPGHVIWAAPLTEDRRSRGGGKGAQPKVTEYSYRLSFALALCEGEINGIGRIWADGEEIAPEDLNMRVYHGDAGQMPDPCISAHEGDEAPAYRGVAYVVFEELPLERWGNRVPQFSFEVIRQPQGGRGLAHDVRAVAIIPGTGEYTLATRPVNVDMGLGEQVAVNRNTGSGLTDFATSLEILGRELPKAGAASLVVSWFGDDLRAGHCTLRPKVEDSTREARDMAWRAGGIDRAAAQEVARRDERPVYGGTPADGSVVEALRALRAAGKKPMFYPFILMEQQPGNGLPDPYGGDEQPVMPWRGRITTEIAPGRAGSSDGTEAAGAEVAAFFGQAQPAHFRIKDEQVFYDGPVEDWGYRRFILHYAHLCALAGGVDAFLIGSEMRDLTRIRGVDGYPAVAELCRLAAEVRAILGPQVHIGYAADWSEYYGHHTPDGDVRFHLDPLWAHPAIGFVGIDNYMPLSDWRDGEDHLDAHWGRIDNPDYLAGNVAGGEGYDWYYAAPEHRDAQIRTPIADAAHGEDWIWRYKDLRGWWGNAHHERIGGVRQAQATPWVPGSKPIWFTEIGCAALDKATNQPNKFLDALSSESALPFYSDGRRDDALQQAYFRALTQHWSDPAQNPAMAGGGRMVDLSRAYVWAWDARPYPAFPARTDLWSDGPAWARGHWLNGRAGAAPLRDVVAEICQQAGVTAADVSGLSGVLRGYALQGGETGRAALQALMLTHGFDAVERDGRLQFRSRDGRLDAVLEAGDLAEAEGLSQPEYSRAPEPELAGCVRLTHVEAGGDFAIATAETMLPEADRSQSSSSEYPMALTRGEARAVAERWLSEARVARDAVRFALPPSHAALGPGDVVSLPDARGVRRRWRIDRVERAGAMVLDAVRVEPSVYQPADALTEGGVQVAGHVPPVPVWPVFLDLPLLRGDEAPHAPYLAVTATPWAGAAAAWMSASDEGGFTLNRTILRPSVMGQSLTPMARARAGLTDRGPALRVRMKGGALASADGAALLAGANLMAIGDGSPENWELFQFARADLVAPGVWDLSGRLRGQAGSDALMPDVWPVGSTVVMLDGAARQVDLSPSARGQMRWWRVGPALRAPDDPSYRQIGAAFSGVGLRPLAPVHLRLAGRQVSWVRRSRIGGDGWDGPDVPLGEGREAYVVRLMRGGAVLHEASTAQPRWLVPQPVWDNAVAGGDFDLAVAQLSETYGPGLFARRTIHV
ncbi:baseplate multidomain protein megatron [Paracoccus jiaweipingae]|uniref:baseplate multidomain protein megatron n=1 Tax=Paracoccus sp. p2-l61 TaxID=3366950 RepID=UPI0037917BF8